METHDHVDGIVTQWERERPDLDVSSIAVVGRISRLSRHLEKRLNPVFGRHGLNSGEFDVLCALRRAGEPYQLTPTALSTSVMLTSGAMTNRLDRLEEAGLIVRRADPDDRRSTFVSLTPSGFELVDRAVEDHVSNERELLTICTKAEITTLTRLLRKLLSQFDETWSP